MTLAEARRILSSRGIVLRHQDGEYRVNYVRGREATAYYTTDLDDAVQTGLQMAHGKQNPEISRRKARLILHHGEVRGYPLTEPQRRFFGARASGYPRRRTMARRRRRRLPPMAGHSVYRGHYRHNPGGGTNWMPLLLIGGAAIFLLPKLTGGTGLFGGTSVLPAGYTYLGSGYYRGPDGQTYYRSPTTGQMSPVSATQAASGQVTQAGMNILTGVLPTVTTGITSFLKGLFTPAGGGAMTEQSSLLTGTVEGDVLGTGAYTGGFSDVLRSGDGVGYEPAPLPEFP